MTKEEAIEKVRQMSLPKETMEILEALAPELRESEDERIRKEISTLYADIDSCISELLAARTNKDAEAEGKALFRMEGLMVATLQDLSCVEDWLEKQKDASKSIEAVDRIDKYIDEHLANAHDMKDSNPDKKYYRGWDDALGKMAGILQDVYSEKENKFAPRVLPCSAAWFEDGEEKQKEQKPSIFPPGLGEVHWNPIPSAKKELVEKPAEWSEEDEKVLNELITIMDGGKVTSGTYLSEYVAWLKSLRPQPHKEIYQAAKHDLAIKFMNYLDENRPEGKMGLSNSECKDIDKAFKENDWAKIMRYVEKYSPSWKPTEEQMIAFRNYIDSNRAKAEASVGGWNNYDAMIRLFEDLKKL